MYALTQAAVRLVDTEEYVYVKHCLFTFLKKFYHLYPCMHIHAFLSQGCPVDNS